MSRISLSLTFAAIIGLGFAMANQATAGSEDRKAMCFPKTVITSAGDKDTEFAAGATIFMNRMIDEGRNNFAVLDNNGVEIICAWP